MTWVRCLFVLILFASVRIVIAQPRPTTVPVKGQISDSASELLHRMNDQWKVDIETAVGGYVLRTFNRHDETGTLDQLAQYRKTFEENKRIRIANAKALGGRADERALDAEMEKNIASLKEVLSRSETETIAVRYAQQGSSYRIEQFNLSNDTPLEQLRDELKKGVIQFQSTYTRTWNGKRYAEITKLETKSNPAGGGSTQKPSDVKVDTKPQASAALAYEDRSAGACNFTRYGRDDAADPMALQKMANKGFSVTTAAAQSKDGKEAVTLRVGVPESLSMYVEAVVLPTKGYCVTSSFVKMNGLVMNQAEYEGFVSTSSGAWMPTKIMRETHRLDDRQVPYLATKIELLAFEPPQTNIPLAPDTFDLANTKEFKALPLSTRMLPQGNPYLTPKLATNNSHRILFVFVNLLVVVALAAVWIYRRYFRLKLT